MKALYDAATFGEFWAGYERLHASPRTRAMHFVATSAAGVLVALALVRGSLMCLVAAPLVDYAIAQLSHRLEGARTQPYRKPLWHVRAELRAWARYLNS